LLSAGGRAWAGAAWIVFPYYTYWCAIAILYRVVLFCCNQVIQVFGRFINTNLDSFCPAAEGVIFRTLIVANRRGPIPSIPGCHL